MRAMDVAGLSLTGALPNGYSHGTISLRTSTAVIGSCGSIWSGLSVEPANRHSMPGRTRRSFGLAGGGGLTQSPAWVASSAVSVNAFQIWAGKVPPWTRGTPDASNSAMSIMGVEALGSPTHTAVVSCGAISAEIERRLSMVLVCGACRVS